MTVIDLARIRTLGQELLPSTPPRFRLVAQEYGPAGRAFRQLFDAVLDQVHYARSCQRVGRCMRLAILDGERWLGGIVLGSTFPNIGCRDAALGLKPLVQGKSIAELRSVWAQENTLYWNALQRVVNHARTFVFPEFQGRGVGIRAHSLLLTEGVRLWRCRYPGKVHAFDTLCDAKDSGLFVKNSWTHVGQTKGYSSDRQSVLVQADPERVLKNNVALKPGGRTWEVWVREL